MAEKTLEQLYAEMNAEREDSIRKQTLENMNKTISEEALLRDYYENGKICGVNTQLIKTNAFDYKEAERIFAKAMTLVESSKWIRHPLSVSIDDVEIEWDHTNWYDNMKHFKGRIKTNGMHFKTYKKESHFGLDIPTMEGVKEPYPLHFQMMPLFARNGVPKSLPLIEIPKAQIDLVNYVNKQLNDLQDRMFGSQEYVYVPFRYLNPGSPYRALSTYLFKDGYVFELNTAVWKTWKRNKSEDECAAEIAFSINHPDDTKLIG